jgi:hypothetical protein
MSGSITAMIFKERFMMQKLEKRLFPRLPRDQRQREMRNWIFIVLTALCFAGGIALMLIKFSSSHL